MNMKSALKILSNFSDHLARETYDDKQKERWDPPEDFEHQVAITSGMEGQVQKAILFLETENPERWRSIKDSLPPFGYHQYVQVIAWNRKTGEKFWVPKAYKTKKDSEFGWARDDGRSFTGKKAWSYQHRDEVWNFVCEDEESIVVTHWRPLPKVEE